MRGLIFALLGAAAVHAQDAVEIVRRAAAADDRGSELRQHYTYLQRQEQREIDSSGKLKKTESDTVDITLLEGSPYRRHVAHNDKPLPPKEQAREDEKLRRSIEERRKETPEMRQYRLQEWDRRQKKQREPLKELPDAFHLKLAGEESIDGVAAWVIEAMPKPGYRPHSNATQFFPKVKGRLWITKEAYEVVKVEIESLDTISFGGFLIRMARGSRILVEAARVNNEVWLPKSAILKGSVRIALIKVLRGEIVYTFSNYKKFQADSRVISVGQQP
jgi:hypothetical protein